MHAQLPKKSPIGNMKLYFHFHRNVQPMFPKSSMVLPSVCIPTFPPYLFHWSAGDTLRTSTFSFFVILVFVSVSAVPHIWILFVTISIFADYSFFEQFLNVFRFFRFLAFLTFLCACLLARVLCSLAVPSFVSFFFSVLLFSLRFLFL